MGRLSALWLLLVATLWVFAGEIEDEKVVHGRLENGLTYYVRETGYPEGTASLRLVVKVGSIHERDEEQGWAHFIEHLVFQAAGHFDEKELNHSLELLGSQSGIHSNASTHFAELPQEDKRWMKKFFTDFFIEGTAIYTLFGTKPMSQITLVQASETEWLASIDPYIQNEREEKKAEISRKRRDQYNSYDLPQNWDKWMVWRKKCQCSPFSFAKRTVDDNPKLFSLYIINIPEVTWTLQKYYSLFSRELKMEFDPLSAALEFENPDSTFWNKIFANHLLQGILHGYGERNAYFFSRESAQEENSNSCIFASTISTTHENDGTTLEDLQLPLFRSYRLPLEEDPMIMKYEQERQTIQEFLKGKNFTEEVLNRLCI